MKVGVSELCGAFKRHYEKGVGAVSAMNSALDEFRLEGLDRSVGKQLIKDHGFERMIGYIPVTNRRAMVMGGHRIGWLEKHELKQDGRTAPT